MTEHNQALALGRVTHFIHQYFLPLLVSSYVAAGIFPQPGLALRKLSFGALNLPASNHIELSISLVMLSLLLFNAGVGSQASQLRGLLKKPALLLVGLACNILVPIALVTAFRGVLLGWHNADELQNLLVGLALIAAMPIAGSSATWTQNANGNIALSLGLVLVSTVLSPLVTPLVLHYYGALTNGDYSEDLHELAMQGTNAFLCVTVVFPSLAGLAVHAVVGEKRIVEFKPILKLVNLVTLLILNYSNACISLPDVFAHPDWDLLAFVLAATGLICAFAFYTGALIARVFKAESSDRAALMFSLGMNNNGTGLVLASAALADHPNVLVPLISYTLIQQVAAAVVDRFVIKAKD